MEEIPNPTPDDAIARATLEQYLSTCRLEHRIVGLHDSDADGVTAGVVWQRALERLGYQHVRRLVPDRERNAWTENNRSIIREANPERCFLMDLGSRNEAILDGVPVCVIDHHRPEGEPPQGVLISAYSWEPVPNTSLMVYDLFSPLVDLTDLNWVAAIGTMSDLGEKAPFELLEQARRQYTAKWLKEATALVNAARRASHYDPEAAARALLEHTSPRQFVESESSEVAQMKAAREEVKQAMDVAKKAAPKFAGPVALIRIDSPCQIHPLIAQIWRTRLPKYIVIAANEGYLPGRVNFSARGTGALDFLKSVELPPGEGSFGHGHDGASGGSLPVERWHQLLQAIGFEG